MSLQTTDLLTEEHEADHTNPYFTSIRSACQIRLPIPAADSLQPNLLYRKRYIGFGSSPIRIGISV